MKILIIQPAFIGDVVLATAFAESLHKLYPDAQLDFFLRKGTESLLENHPYIHQRIVWDKKNNKFGHLIHLIRKIRRERYDRDRKSVV